MGLLVSPLGKITQNIDNLNFRGWKDKNVVARRVTHSNQPNNAAQQAVKRRFALLVHFSRLLSATINLGFRKSVASMTVFNKFVKLNMDNTTDNGTAASLTYANLIVSQGSVLAPGTVSTANGAGSGEVLLTISDNSNGTTGLSSDALRVAWINTTDGTAGEVNPSKTRTTAATQFILSLGTVNEGDTVKLYPYFYRASTGDCSDNSYASHATV